MLFIPPGTPVLLGPGKQPPNGSGPPGVFLASPHPVEIGEEDGVGVGLSTGLVTGGLAAAIGSGGWDREVSPMSGFSTETVMRMVELPFDFLILPDSAIVK